MTPDGSKIGNDYYNSNRDKFVSLFEISINNARDYLSTKYNNDIANGICSDAKNEFSKLLSGLPFVGGNDNPNTRWVLLAGQWLSFYKSMNARGYSVVDTAQLMYNLFIESLNAIPQTELEKLASMVFSKEMIDAIKFWSGRKVEHPMENWLIDFVPGDEKEFDYGYNTSYCPCLEYFKIHNAKEIAPYFCLVDFPESKLLGSGLIRTKTLAQGDSLCNFRLKKGRTVLQDWETEVPKFK
jgi:hypothetical protein